MGCSSSSAVKADAKAPAAEVITGDPGAPAEQPSPTLTEATAEEKALVQLKLVFESVDSNQDKAVSKDELTTALNKDEQLSGLVKEAGFAAEYNVLESLDTNADGFVSWEEFVGHLKGTAVKEVKETGKVAAAEAPADAKVVKRLQDLFDSIDKDENGTVSKEELNSKLQQSKDEHGLMQDDAFAQLIEEAGFNPTWHAFESLDTNHDGKITWEEFEAHLRRAAKAEVVDTGDLMAAVVPDDEEDQERPPASASWWGCGGCA